VGLPAYSDDSPVRHLMETGSPMARYAIVERFGQGAPSGSSAAGPKPRPTLQLFKRFGNTACVELISIPYDFEGAAEAAEKNGRADWAFRLRTGRATLD